MQNNSVSNQFPLELTEFDALPDSAFVPVEIVARLLGGSANSVWRWSAAETIPRPVRVGQGSTRWQVGALRDYLRRAANSNHDDRDDSGVGDGLKSLELRALELAADLAAVRAQLEVARGDPKGRAASLWLQADIKRQELTHATRDRDGQAEALAGNRGTP
jgi:predicted DNA-binding transcriptional regulator AlpA